jgi:O-antigen/teichoic acid export membrane protein
MFGVILQGRYNDGLAVLPWTLAGCVISGIYVVAQNYLWCAEHPRLAALPLAIGLLIYVILNLFMIPAWGLHGAVVATGIGTVACLAIILVLSQRHGMKLDLGTWLICGAPLSLAWGVIPSTAALIAIVAIGFVSQSVFDTYERRQMLLFFASSAAKLKAKFPKLAAPLTAREGSS